MRHGAGGRRVGDVHQAELDELLHGPGDRQLGQAQVVGDAADGGAATDGDERRPARLVDGDLALRAASMRSVTQASIDGTTASMDRHSSRSASDWARRISTSVGRRRVVVGGLGVEGEGALLEAQQLEQRVDRLVGVGGVGGLDPDDLAGGGPDAAGAPSAGDAQPAGLLRGREEAQHIRQGERVEGPLQGHC